MGSIRTGEQGEEVPAVGGGALTHRLVLPPAPATETGPVKLWEQPVEMVTYACAAPDVNPQFWDRRVYQGSSGRVYPLPVIDRIETTPQVRRWRAVHLENQYLRVMVLPEIGGRIHVALDKRTGYDFIYRQNVIKPALVGLAGPWISGGIEFNWPQHHRPATFLPVETALERRPDGSAIVWCGDHDPMERMKGMHGVCLHDGRAVMEVLVRLYNRTTETKTFLWWANVATHVHERYQSFFPRDARLVADHAKRAVTTYPLSNGTYYGIDYGARAERGIEPEQKPRKFVPEASIAPNDLGWYANIPVPTSYMIANSKGDFFGGYDHARQAGVVAVADHHIQPGKKQWTWGNHEFGYAWDRSLTEEDGPYIELMLGAYTDNQPDFSFLAPGETKSFSQFWYPIAGIGVPDMANVDLAMRLERREMESRLHVQATRALAGCEIFVEEDGKHTLCWQGDLTAATPLQMRVAGVAKCGAAVMVRQGRRVLLRYAPDESIAAEPPEVAKEPAPPEEMESSDELYLTGVHLEQYRHATRPPMPYWKEALRRDAGDSRSNLAMGKHYLRCGDLERAEQALRRSVERLVRLNPNPADGESHYQLGRVLDLAGRVDGAYDAYFKATWNAAWAAPGYHRLAEIACRRGEWELALEHVERSLIKSADNLGALGLKALLLRQLGREEEGRALAATTLTMDPLDVWARMIVRQETPRDGQQCLDLCFDLLRAGFRSQVHALLTESLRMDAAGVEGSRAMRCYLLASVARAMGMHVEAAENAKSARESDTNYVFPHRIEEMLLLEEALRMDSRDARAHLALGNLLYDKGRREEAIAHWRDAADLEPELAVAWRNLGLGLYNVSRDAAGALAAYACARRAAPQDARLLYEEYQLRSRIGEPASSLLAYLETAWPLVLRRDDLTLEAAALLNSLRRPQDALELLLSRQFQPWEGGEGRVLGQYMRALILLAREALRNGDARSAVERLEQALRPPHCLAEALHVLQNTSDVAYWLGVSYEMAGDMEAARKQWERAAARRADFREMSMAPVSGTTYWSGMALRALGREVEAEETFREMETYAAKLRSETAKIDYFATSLPNMLLFEDDIDARQKTEAMFLAALAAIGTGRGDARAELAHVLLRDQNHAGALDVLWLSER